MADQTMVVTDGVKTGILDITNHANVLIGTAAAGDQFLMPNDGRTVLVCVCAAAPAAIAFTAITNQWGRTETLSVTPTANNTSIIGPFPPHLWSNAIGQVEFDPAGGGVATDYYLAVRIK